MKKNKKILAKHMRPGMVINTDLEKTKFPHIALVTACSGFTEVEFTHFSFQDSYGGKLVGSINGEDEVIVVRGKQRKYIIEKIKENIFKYYHDAKDDVDLIRLIEEM